jgi:glycerol-3-phosphate dehydrogenase subunit C
VLEENFATPLKLGRPGARQAFKNATRFVASECPLAGMHTAQGMEIDAGPTGPLPRRQLHPIDLVARAYGIAATWSDPDARSR